MNQNIFNEKKEQNLKIKERFGFLKKNKCNGLVILSDKNLIIELRDAFVLLGVNFVIEIKNIREDEKLGKNIVATSNIPENLLAGFDFLICDKNISNLKKYFEKGIVPIISKENSLKTILKDFDAMKNEGNCFIFENENKWFIFQALIRYLENYKFPFDNKNLVKNILEI